MSQLDPICTPDYYFEMRGMKHFFNAKGDWDPSLVYKYMNGKEHGNYFIDERLIRPLSPVKEE